MTFHIVYKPQATDFISKGINYVTESPELALKTFYHEFPGATFIALYSIDRVSDLLNLQKEIAAMPNPPSRNERNPPKPGDPKFERFTG